MYTLNKFEAGLLSRFGSEIDTRKFVVETAQLVKHPMNFAFDCLLAEIAMSNLPSQPGRLNLASARLSSTSDHVQYRNGKIPGILHRFAAFCAGRK